MIFALSVHAAPGCGSSAALEFAHAVISMGHRIERVFFYEEGVRVAAPTAAGTYRPLTLDWSALKRQHGIELAVCVGALERRGLRPVGSGDSEEAVLHPDFSIVGLGQLTDAIVHSDRLLVFTE